MDPSQLAEGIRVRLLSEPVGSGGALDGRLAFIVKLLPEAALVRIQDSNEQTHWPRSQLAVVPPRVGDVALVLQGRLCGLSGEVLELVAGGEEARVALPLYGRHQIVEVPLRCLGTLLPSTGPVGMPEAEVTQTATAAARPGPMGSPVPLPAAGPAAAPEPQEPNPIVHDRAGEAASLLPPAPAASIPAAASALHQDVPPALLLPFSAAGTCPAAAPEPQAPNPIIEEGGMDEAGDGPQNSKWKGKAPAAASRPPPRAPPSAPAAAAEEDGGRRERMRRGDVEELAWVMAAEAASAGVPEALQALLVSRRMEEEAKEEEEKGRLLAGEAESGPKGKNEGEERPKRAREVEGDDEGDGRKKEKKEKTEGEGERVDEGDAAGAIKEEEEEEGGTSSGRAPAGTDGDAAAQPRAVAPRSPRSGVRYSAADMLCLLDVIERSDLSGTGGYATWDPAACDALAKRRGINVESVRIKARALCQKYEISEMNKAKRLAVLRALVRRGERL